MSHAQWRASGKRFCFLSTPFTSFQLLSPRQQSLSLSQQSHPNMAIESTEILTQMDPKEFRANTLNYRYLDTTSKADKAAVVVNVDAQLAASDAEAALQTLLALTGKSQAIHLGGVEPTTKILNSTVPVIKDLPVYRILDDVRCSSLPPSDPSSIAFLPLFTPWFNPDEVRDDKVTATLTKHRSRHASPPSVTSSLSTRPAW